MTTWQNYIDFLLAKGNISHLMIVSKESGSLWAGTQDFFLREFKTIITKEVIRLIVITGINVILGWFGS